MIFLLIRTLPYFIPLIYLISLKAIFYFTDYWFWLILPSIILFFLWFFLLKIRNSAITLTNLLPTIVYGFIILFTGFLYLIILEQTWIINLFLISWSFIFWLYLEAVFHNFYKTPKVYIVNLSNITLYSSILIIFFISLALLNFNIFLNWSKILIFIFLFLVYLILLYSIFLFNDWKIKRNQVFSFIISLIMIEFFIVITWLPFNFYISSLLSAILYYFLLMIVFLWNQQQLNKKNFMRYLLFSLLLVIVVLSSAKMVLR